MKNIKKVVRLKYLSRQKNVLASTPGDAAFLGFTLF